MTWEIFAAPDFEHDVFCLGKAGLNMFGKLPSIAMEEVVDHSNFHSFSYTWSKWRKSVNLILIYTNYYLDLTKNTSNLKSDMRTSASTFIFIWSPSLVSKKAEQDEFQADGYEDNRGVHCISEMVNFACNWVSYLLRVSEMPIPGASTCLL